MTAPEPLNAVLARAEIPLQRAYAALRDRAGEAEARYAALLLAARRVTEAYNPMIAMIGYEECRVCWEQNGHDPECPWALFVKEVGG